MSNLQIINGNQVASASSVRINALVPASIADALQLADIMAKASLIPDHLRNKPGDCLLVIMQAQRWGMDAVSVAQCTSVVKGKLCYEGKLVAAALYATGAIDGRLHYEFTGQGEHRTIHVTGRPRGTSADQIVTGSVSDWKTDNGNWKKSPDDMLVYRGTRQWARRYAPEALLGVYTPDELEASDEPRTVSARVATERTEYPAHDFDDNLPKWRAAIESGKKTADDIIALVESKGALTEAQRARVRACQQPIEGEFIAAGESK